MKYKTLTLLGLIALTILITLPRTSFGQNDIPQELQFSGADFVGGSGDGWDITAEGLTLADGWDTAVYTSPEITAPLPFNAVVPEWLADIPDGASLTIMLRTRPANGAWTEWQDSDIQADWLIPEDPLLIGEMLFVPNADELHRVIQYRVSFSRYNGDPAPILNQFRLTFIDSTAGPTTEELIAQQAAINAQQAGSQSASLTNPRPTVISRDVWCTNADCDYDPSEQIYYPASHMIVHHTVSSNQGPDYNWAAVVRAIWSYHTYTREWGDIGYNYLVDINGVIYEGYLNEDYENLDVKGIHASGANTGSMGVSLIGTFTAPDYSTPGIAPSEPMKESLVSLLSWKAEQRSINVYDANDSLPYIDWGLPTLMGHRDVYGTTECPGDQAYALLPWLRDQVAARIGLVDPYIYVEETSPAFSKGGTAWNVGPNECGNNGHSYYAWSTTDSSNNVWGEWQLDVPEDGRYRLDVYVPRCYTRAPETDGATYTVTSAGGVDTVTVSHNDQVGLWITLGEYDMYTAGDNRLHLTNVTTTDSGSGVWFDAARLLRVDDAAQAAVGNTLPTNNAWINNPVITFTWSITSVTPVQSTGLQISGNADMSNPAAAESWPTAVYSSTQTLTQDGVYYWQVTAVVSQTNGMTTTIPSTPTLFGLDRTSPTSTIKTIYKIPNAGYLLLLDGQDALSGLDSYNLDYRPQGTITWTNWLTNTAGGSVMFSPPDASLTYEFRSQGIDRAGNTEPAHTEADVNSDQAILLPHAIMLPIILRD
ncbi:MAG TPA: hypothetical protein EYP41_05600 [Anaerolineae bacterium]|nr:hypothetical protein [Anaerolineae bacterium]